MRRRDDEACHTVQAGRTQLEPRNRLARRSVGRAPGRSRPDGHARVVRESLDARRPRTFADITIVPVASDRRDAFVAFSRRMAEVSLAHGATSVVDYWQASGPASQDDFHAEGAGHEGGTLQSIAQSAGADARESVVVTVTTWPSRAARDQGTAAVTRDPRVMATLDEEPVFDGSRLLGNGFEVALRVGDAE